jgi:hypothetical protein
MAFADPQSITVNAVPISLPRTGSSANGGTFTSADTLTKMTISHNNGNRTRHLLRVDSSKVASDPFITGVSTKQNLAAYLVVDVPPSGFTVAEAKFVVDALVAYLTASSGAKVTQLLGGEN